MNDFGTLHAEHEPDAIRRRLQSPMTQSYLADAVPGAIDGCVTTLAIVAGAVGARFSPTVAIVLGIANLLADRFSMAIAAPASCFDALNYTFLLRTGGFPV